MYSISFSKENLTLSYLVADDGKILECRTIYQNGMNGHLCLDDCVDMPDSWLDCNTSQGSLYWLTQDKLDKFEGYNMTVEKTSWPYTFGMGRWGKPTPSQIGDRKVILPETLEKIFNA